MDLAHEVPVASDSAPATDQHAHVVDVLDVAGHLVPELVLFRRDLHANPELSRAEFRTTAAIAARLERAGLAPRVRGVGTGLVCDIVPAGSEKLPFLAFRADIDALAVEETNELEFRSRVPGVMHACGHDLHTTVVLGAGLTLAEMARAGRLARPVRLIFQPAEEVMPGGALDMVAEGALYGVSKILSVHCDPKLDVGQVGLRTGALTAACDMVSLTLDGPGGHTSRPHLTADLVYALASIVAEVPAALSRRIDPRAGLSLVWGQIAAGSAPTRSRGPARPGAPSAPWTRTPGTRPRTWCTSSSMPIAAKFGVKHTLDYVQGVPPVVNERRVGGPAARRRHPRARRGRRGRHRAVARRRGLRLVPAAGARRDGPAGRAHPRRQGRARPAPGDVPGRRGRGLRRGADARDRRAVRLDQLTALPASAGARPSAASGGTGRYPEAAGEAPLNGKHQRLPATSTRGCRGAGR